MRLGRRRVRAGVCRIKAQVDQGMAIEGERGGGGTAVSAVAENEEEGWDGVWLDLAGDEERALWGK